MQMIFAIAGGGAIGAVIGLAAFYVAGSALLGKSLLLAGIHMARWVF